MKQPMNSKKREWYKKLLVKLFLIKEGKELTLDKYILEVEKKLSDTAVTAKDNVR